MNQDVTAGIPKIDEHHWTIFKTAYNTTYADMREKIYAKNKLKTIKMEREDLNTYIATVNKLLTLVGYSNTEYRVLILFKKGLPGPLNISIVQNTMPIPINLKD
jgi:hypothetical protein